MPINWNNARRRGRLPGLLEAMETMEKLWLADTTSSPLLLLLLFFSLYLTPCSLGLFLCSWPLVPLCSVLLLLVFFPLLSVYTCFALYFCVFLLCFFPPVSFFSPLLLPLVFRLCFYCDLLLECSVSGAVAAEDGALELRCERAVGAGAAAGWRRRWWRWWWRVARLLLRPPLFLCFFALFSSLCFFRSLPFVAFFFLSFFCLCSALLFIEPESLP